MTTENKAKTIVERIIEDLGDRRGIGHEWYGIDEEIQAEIIAIWENIAREVIDA